MKINYSYLKKGGFTLIELLVVIAIIGILTAIVTANFSQSKAKSRDAKRVSDLAQIQLTLEMAFDRCNTYPPNIDSVDTEIYFNCKDADGNSYKLSYFISKIPMDTGGTPYSYVQIAGGKDYILGALLETDNPSLMQESATGAISINGTPTNCGAANKFYCVVPK